nr:MAG: PQQ enzyme repeat family protein [Candidatus Nanosalinarum sp. J07AB56]
MRTKTALLLSAALLLTLPTSSAQVFGDSIQHGTRGLESDSNSVYVNSFDTVYRFTTADDLNWTKKFNDKISASVVTKGDYVSLAERRGAIYRAKRSSGEIVNRRNFRGFVDRHSIYGNSDNLLQVRARKGSFRIYKFKNDSSFQLSTSASELIRPDGFDVDSDGAKEILSGQNRRTGMSASVIEPNGQRRWQTKDFDVPGKIRVHYSPTGNILLVYSKQFLRAYDAADGELLWKRDTGASGSNIEATNGLVLTGMDGEVVVREVETGERLKSVRLEEVSDIDGGEAVDFAVVGGESRVLRFDPGTLDFEPADTVLDPRKLEVVDLDSDGSWETVLAGDKRLEKIDSFGVETNRSFQDSVFVGGSARLLEAVSLNRPVLVSDGLSEVERTVEMTGLDPVGVGRVEGVDSVASPVESSDFSGRLWYAEERRKQVLLAALASSNSSVALTLDGAEADRSFKDVSYQELRRRLVREFDVNHVVAGDLDSRNGIVAASVAAQRSASPVNLDFQRADKDGVSAAAWNQGTGASRADRRIEEAFEFIGQNPSRSIAQYVSLLGVPRYAHSVELEEYETDRVYWGDQVYGNLDGDRTVEASVGSIRDASLRASSSARLKAEKGKTRPWRPYTARRTGSVPQGQSAGTSGRGRRRS